MCGALAASACGAAPFRGGAAGLYYGARAATYALLGAATGLLSALAVGRWLGEAGRPLAFAFGAATMGYAALEAWRVRSGRAGQLRTNGVTRALARAQDGLRALPFPRPILLGVTTALLPCGFLAGALLQAALLANPVLSAAGMLAFAVASSPALFAGSRVLATLARRWPRAAPYVAAALMFLAGASMIARAWHVHHHHHAG